MTIDLIKRLKQVIFLQTVFPLISRISWYVNPTLRKRNSYIKNEAARLEQGLRSGNLQRAVLVYDNSVSPPSYGDFINVLMIGRFLVAHHVDVELILTNSGFPSFYSNLLGEDQLQEFVENEKRIATAFVLDIKIDICSSQELRLLLSQYEMEGKYLVFRDYVLNQLTIYDLAFDFTKKMLANSSRAIRDLTLFSKNSIFVNNPILPESKYISFTCRWNESWSQHRNMTTELFLNLVNLLRIEFPSHDLIAVSDQKGCDHFRNIANRNQLRCSFSKDYSDSFLGDVALVLNSDVFVQIRGGGIGTVPLWSDLPLLFFSRISSERSLLSRRTAQLRDRSQQFIVDYGLPSDRRLKKHLSRLRLEICS